MAQRKVLGGSSAINAMVYVRGHPNDYAEWADVAPSWNWSNVNPISKNRIWKGEDSPVSKSGPIGVSNVENHVHPLTYKYLEAGQELGFPYNRDYNGNHMEDAVYQTTTSNGLRYLLLVLTYRKKT